jgi:hypothetical protein
VGEHRGKLGADGGGRRDDHDRDESGNQAIFDGGDAGFVFEKTGDKIFMAEAPFVKKQLLTSAAGCRRDNLTTPRVATKLKGAREFSAHFI